MINSKMCPCGSDNIYKKCCRPFHKEQKLPSTAEQLMRSRYSAFVKRLEKYLQKTWHPDYLPPDMSLSSINWTELEIVSTEQGTPGDYEGKVHFKAWYTTSEGSECHEEISSFVFENNMWLYTKGD